MPPILIDVNIPIYASGREHPLKLPCQRVLRLVGARIEEFITDAEVLQELLHRYHALRIWDVGRQVYAEFSEAMRGRVLPIHHRHIEAAAQMLTDHPRLQARDAIHVAVMFDAGCERIVSADRAFDAVPEVTRLDPMRYVEWADSVGD